MLFRSREGERDKKQNRVIECSLQQREIKTLKAQGQSKKKAVSKGLLVTMVT